METAEHDRIREPLGKTVRERISVVPEVQKIFEGISSVVAWRVAVVSPGFLGLLWNVVELAQHTRLPHVAFSILFIGAESAFLLAIIGSVILHNYATDVAMKMGLVQVLLHGIPSALSDINEPGGKTKHNVERLKTALDQHDAFTETFVWTPPRRVIFFGKVHGASTIAGYIVVGILILSMRLF